MACEVTKSGRQSEIERAACELLRERGYAATSMLAVARAAKASNETLYRWYGDKKGLFRSVVEDNARQIRAALEDVLLRESDPLAGLNAIAPVLLAMVQGEKATLLNRAAAADESGELGHAIANGGREAIVPLIEAVVERGRAAGTIDAPSARMAAEWYVGLVIGDLQIRRVVHGVPELSKDEVVSKVETAMDAFRRLVRA